MAKEMKVGEVREYDGKRYRCEVSDDVCTGCKFGQSIYPDCFKAWAVLGQCGACFRSDSINMHFVEVEDQPQTEDR
jgi:hypothetical protein